MVFWRSRRLGGLRRGEFDSDRAEFETGNLAVGVDFIEGEEVGRGLSEMERDEDRARVVSGTQSRGEFDIAPATAHDDPRALADPKTSGIVGVNAHEGLGFDLVENTGPPSHGSRVPVLE